MVRIIGMIIARIVWVIAEAMLRNILVVHNMEIWAVRREYKVVVGKG